MLQDNNYDVVIIGAGPAGLAAAQVLAENNKNVLVLEKNQMAGDKVCAGGLTLKDFEELGLPKFIAEKEFSSANLYFNEHLIKLELEEPWLWTCNRQKLGGWQASEAQKEGAEIQFNSKVTAIQNDFVLVNNATKFFFKYLIGADGSNSLVRKFLGLKTKKILTVFHYLATPIEKLNELGVFFDLKKLTPTYSWIFPHQDYISVGTGTDPKLMKVETAKRNFDAWCKKIGVNASECKFEAGPLNYDYRGVQFGNVFLAGDAAGVVSGVTGEGIHPAIISGKEVAYKIINPQYDFKKLKEIIKTKNLEETLLTLYKINPGLVKMVFNLFGLMLKTKSGRKKLIAFLTEK